MNYLENHLEHVWMVGVIAVAAATVSLGPGVGFGLGIGFAAGLLMCGAMLAAIVLLISRPKTTTTQNELESAENITADAAPPQW